MLLYHFFVRHELKVTEPPADSAECPICYCDWEPEENDVVETPCHHVYHKHCLLHWFKMEDYSRTEEESLTEDKDPWFCTCPLDRKPLCWSPTETDCSIEAADEVRSKLENAGIVAAQLYRRANPDGFFPILDSITNNVARDWPRSAYGDWLSADALRCIVINSMIRYSPNLTLRQWADLSVLRLEIIEQSDTMIEDHILYLWDKPEQYTFSPKELFRRAHAPRDVTRILRNDDMSIGHIWSMSQQGSPANDVYESVPGMKIEIGKDENDACAAIRFTQLGPVGLLDADLSLEPPFVMLQFENGSAVELRFHF
jgi:hypothetical protein